MDYGEGHMECYSERLVPVQFNQCIDDLIPVFNLTRVEQLSIPSIPYAYPDEYFHPLKIPKDRSLPVNALRGPPYPDFVII